MPDAFSINRLHELTGVDRRTIKKRITAAGVVPMGDGYPAPDALKAIFGDSKKKTEDIAISEARIFAANAISAEVKAAKAQSKVIEAQVADLAWCELGIYVVRGLEVLPGKVASQFGLPAGEFVRQELNDILSELSKPISYKESEDAEADDESVSGDTGAEAETSD